MQIKEMLFRSFALKILLKFFRKTIDSSITIVMGHGVYDDQMLHSGKPPTSSISIEIFRKNIESVKDLEIISLSEAVEMLTGVIPWRKRCIVFTFDDSLKTHLTLVAPVFASLNKSAAFFISTDAIENNKPYWWRRLEYLTDSMYMQGGHAEVMLSDGTSLIIDSRKNNDLQVNSLKKHLKFCKIDEIEMTLESIERQLDIRPDVSKKFDPHAELLTWDDIIKMAGMGMEIGGHTCSHSNVSILSESNLEDELIRSQSVIYKNTGLKCKHFAFPYGIYTSESRAAVEKAGYISALTTDFPGWNKSYCDLYALRRFSIPEEGYKLAYIVSGLYAAIPWHAGIQKLHEKNDY